jgi:hydrogenase expression/formation protein HypC
MCLGVPGLLVEIMREDDILMGRVAFGGITKRVCLEHVADAKPGDYVLVHVGFALQKLDELEAKRTFALLEELNMLDEIQSDETPLAGGLA